MKKNNKKFFIGLTVAVLLPFSFYLVAKILKKDHLVMPQYYFIDGVEQKKVDGNLVNDTQYHQVAELVLANQLGDTVSLNKDLPTKMLLISFFNSKDTFVSGLATRNIAYFLHRAFRKNDTTLQFVSISLDFELDTLNSIKNFSKLYPIDPDNWWFVTGEKDHIKNYIEHELGIKKAEQREEHNFKLLDSTNIIVLVDKQRYIRGYYNALDTFALKKCADDVGLISMQKRKK